MPARLSLRALALLLAAVVGTTASHDSSAESLWLDAARSSITNNELHGHVSVLADDMLEGREGGTRGALAAAKYLLERINEAQLKPAGNQGRFTQSFMHNHQNLLAILPGTDPELKDEYILVGAHYDHVGYGSRRNSYGPWGYIHNGADDNASGVAAVLEVIDALSQTGHWPRRSILFAFWDGEEQGLLGSKHWKSHPTVPLSAIKMAINVDMVGRMTDGRIEVGGTRSAVGSRQLMSSRTLSDEVWLDFNWEYKNNSDHWTFFEAGIPSLYLHTGVHDDYHRPSDDVEKLNIEGIRLVSSYLLEQLSKLADMPSLPEHRAIATRESPATQRPQEQPLPAIASRLDFAWQYVASVPATVVVQQVPWGSQAQQAGLAVGDRIVAVNEQPIRSEATLPAIALQGETNLRLEIQPAGSSAPTTTEPTTIELALLGNPLRLGLSWRADPAEPNSVYVTRVVPHSPAAQAGLQLHDRIYELNGEPITGANELLTRVRQLLTDGEQTLHCLIETRGGIREVEIRLGLPVEAETDATL